MGSKYFSDDELRCHGDGCCDGGVENINPLLLEKLDALREMIGGPIELSCAYRCPIHNEEVGGVENIHNCRLSIFQPFHGFHYLQGQDN